MSFADAPATFSSSGIVSGALVMIAVQLIPNPSREDDEPRNLCPGGPQAVGNASVLKRIGRLRLRFIKPRQPESPDFWNHRWPCRRADFDPCLPSASRLAGVSRPNR